MVKSIPIPTWQEAMDVALSTRPDLLRQRLQVKQTELDLEARRSEVLPQVNFVASGRTQALAQRADQSLGDIATIAFPGYSFGLQIEVPLGNLAARSRELEATTQVSIQRQQLRAIEITVIKEVRDAIRQLIYGEER